MASRLIKDSGRTAVPYLWNGQPSASPAANGTISHARTSEHEIGEYYQQGFRDGEAAGKASRAEAGLDQLAQTVATLADTRATVFRSAQVDILRLSIAIARRILHREILMSPDALGGIISVVLDRIDEQDAHRVRVHPTFVSRVEELLARRNTMRKIQVVADPSLGLGGCVFETQQGNVDAGIESQLSEIERGLADHLEAMP